MLALAHMGITLGSVVLADGMAGRLFIRAQPETRAANPSGRGRPFLDTVDLRLVLVGSLLPDIIDKPLGWLLFSQGRAICHTLLFLILICLAGVWLYRSRGKLWLLVLTFGTLAHLLLDQMWRHPKTLLWPFYGLAFEKLDIGEVLEDMIHGLWTDPSVFVPEAIGAGVLMWFVFVLVRRRKIHAFVKEGWPMVAR